MAHLPSVRSADRMGSHAARGNQGGHKQAFGSVLRSKLRIPIKDA
jgi:hypothetical protein